MSHFNASENILVLNKLSIAIRLSLKQNAGKHLHVSDSILHISWHETVISCFITYLDIST